MHHLRYTILIAGVLACVAQAGLAGDFVNRNDLPLARSVEEASKMDVLPGGELRIENVASADADKLLKFREVSVLSLKAADLCELELAFLHKFEGLRVLQLEGFELRGDAGSVDFGAVPTIQIIELIDCKLPINLLLAAVALESLRKLSVRGSSVFGEAPASCEYGGHLTHASLADAIFVPLEGAKVVGRATSLEWLNLSGAVNVPNVILDGLEHLQLLEHLDISTTKASDSFVDRALALPRLRSLNLFGCSTFTAKDRPKSQRIETLVIGGRMTPASQWLWLSECVTPDSLTVMFHDFDPASWKAVTTLASVKTLRLLACDIQNAPAFATLALPSLKVLEIEYMPALSNATLDKWVRERPLEQLTISDCAGLDDGGMRALSEAEIIELRLRHLPNVSDAGVKVLAKSQFTTQMELAHMSAVSKDALVHLMRESRLIRLTLAGFALDASQIAELESVREGVSIRVSE